MMKRKKRINGKTRLAGEFTAVYMSPAITGSEIIKSGPTLKERMLFAEVFLKAESANDQGRSLFQGI